MNTLGILGGVGPDTTAKVYLALTDLVRKSGEEKYPAIVIYNLPFPFIVENEAIIEGRNVEKMIPYLIDGAKILEKSGATFGILPCNTLHKYIEEIRSSVKIPFLSILDETASRLKVMQVQKIGVLATQTTVDDRLYDDVLKKNGIETLYPEKTEQDSLNQIIVDLLNGKRDNKQNEELEKISLSLKEKGAEAILLACTDLQIVASHMNISIPVVDTTEILIQASLRELLNKGV